jgi:NAD(P)-dependent dehydrogenase (short-subunit alcohol dehydrogenase family)
MRLTGKTCLITGGLSGIGVATAHTLAQFGANISVAGSTSDAAALAKVREDVESYGCRFHFIRSNVDSVRSCARVVEETQAALGSIDILVHSAGAAVPGGLLKLSDREWERAFDVHVHAIFRLCRAAVPLMKNRGEGSIILISPAAELRGCLDALAYGVVKGALPQFARALARELASDNIRVNCVSPGLIRSPFQDHLSPEQVQNNIQNLIPLKREGRPDDVSSLIVEVLSNDFITGENVVIDGGVTMRMV